MSMKLLKWGTAVILAGMLAGCATAPRNELAKYTDEQYTDVIVHFLSWQSITVAKPDTRAGGFLPLYDKTSVEPILQSQSFGHGQAAVTCSYTLGPDLEAEVQQYWIDTFTALGFDKIVFLRANGAHRVDGMGILRVVDLNPKLASENRGNARVNN